MLDEIFFFAKKKAHLIYIFDVGILDDIFPSYDVFFLILFYFPFSQGMTTIFPVTQDWHNTFCLIFYGIVNIINVINLFDFAMASKNFFLTFWIVDILIISFPIIQRK